MSLLLLFRPYGSGGPVPPTPVIPGVRGRKKKPVLRIKLEDLKERPEYEAQLRWTIAEAQRTAIEQKTVEKKELRVIGKASKIQIQDGEIALTPEMKMRLQNAKDEEELITILSMI